MEEEKNLIEGMLSKNKESQYEGLKEFRDILSRVKNDWEAKIIKDEIELKNKIQSLTKDISEKELKISKLESMLNDFKSKILIKLEKEANDRISQKLNEIQNLNSRNKDLKSTIDELTQDRDLVESKYKQSQSLIKELQQKIKANEDEIINIKKTADEQEAIANSLYENRFNEKNKEIEKLESDLRKKVEQAAIDHFEKDKIEQNLIREKALKDKIEQVLEKI